MITFPCSQCGRQLRAPDEAAGKKVKCPRCGAATPTTRPVPAQAPPTATAGPAPEGPLDAPVPAAPPTREIDAADAATLPPAPVEVLPIPPGMPLPSLPGYELLEELGRGGMGVVYKARQARPRRLVALKMILAGEHAGANALHRFRTEAEAVARLAHPGIVQVYEVGEHNGLPYLALEYIEGGSLADRLRRGRLRPRQAAALLHQLARAVQHAHQKGIVHRDLKPANVLLTALPEGGDDEAGCSAKVVDFGLAKPLEGMTSLRAGGPRTQSGAVLGTPSYMAPEQAGGKSRDIGPAADVYALGAILYECLTGLPPFQGDSLLDTLIQVTTEEPTPPRELRPQCPPALEAICLKCLRKAPADRYASAGALADDLKRHLDGEPVAARSGGALARLGAWARGHKGPAALAVAALALGLALPFVLIFWPRGGEDETGGGPAGETARERVQQAANRAASANNLKQMAIAMQAAHDSYSYMPPAAILDPRTGKRLLSWRVALLPFIEQQPLYKQFRLDEPWDSPHNLPLLAHMPKTYQLPGAAAQAGHTFYQVFEGPGALFDTKPAILGGPFGAQGPRFVDITDGAGQTILIAEAARAVPWTAPEDLPYDPKEPLPKLGGAFKGGFNVVMADGIVVFVRSGVSEKTLRAAITPNGGDILGPDWPDGNGSGR
jgi:tRNA A-37 threonylcarbamoyl transferase component Bud32